MSRFCFLINETPRGSLLISAIERDTFVLFKVSESLFTQAAGKSQMYTACSDYITRNYALISFNFHPSENLCNPMSSPKSLMIYFITSLGRMNQQQGQHLSQCKGSFSPEGKAMEDFRGLKNSPISSSTDDLRKGE